MFLLRFVWMDASGNYSLRGRTQLRLVGSEELWLVEGVKCAALACSKEGELTENGEMRGANIVRLGARSAGFIDAQVY